MVFWDLREFGLMSGVFRGYWAGFQMILSVTARVTTH